ncbi:hypothetical protein [Ralstonia solanacearum]|uniref:Uncharacterized protein n=1 Tax=Ralstonia solanacearum TaxID=305 RepID=A0AAE3NI89_RALSL|nr:hypothetical protein [Ralstonia solanacearum]MBB6582768.1 hypothetical protein [Ralstonia solanacearum]MDB0522410.1 hypothetical protein [Ralstonia solanacearum]
MQHYAPALPEYKHLPQVPNPFGRGEYFTNRVAVRQIATAYVPGWPDQFVYYVTGTTGAREDVEVEEELKVQAQLQALRQWKRYVFDPASPTDVDAISETVDRVFDVISEFGPGALSLADVRPDEVQGEHLAAVLRASSSWADAVPGWSNALQVAATALTNSGIDPNDALYGMIDIE